MTLLAHTAVPVERLLIFQPFNQQHTSSLRDELHSLLISKDILPDQLIGIHFASSLGFTVLPQHYILQENLITAAFYQDILKSIHDVCEKEITASSDSIWIVLDMSWIKLLPNPLEQQERFIQSLIQSEILKQHHIIFHFNLDVMGAILIQQSISLYPYLYWNHQLAENIFFHSSGTPLHNDPITSWLSIASEQSIKLQTAENSEKIFHQIYDCFPHPVLEADYSEIMEALDQVKREQPNEWRTFLQGFTFRYEYAAAIKDQACQSNCGSMGGSRM
jgi:hypothetical protein